MRLQIENFAKIRKADIQVRGLTVICGLNNTGKSTVGKVLHSIFNSLHGIDDAVADQRKKLVAEEFKAAMYRLPESDSIPKYRGTFIPRMNIASRLARRAYGSKEQVQESIIKELDRYMGCNEEVRAWTERLADVVWEVLTLPEENVRKTYVESFFMQMFGGQVVSIFDNSQIASVKLELQHNVISMAFDESQCVTLENPVTILHRSIFIDNPYIIDALADERGIYFRTGGMRHAEKELVGRLRRYKRAKQAPSNAFKRALVLEKLAEVERCFSQVIQGSIVNGNDGLAIQHTKGGRPLRLQNLSLGVKSFIMLYMLLDSLQLQKQDVLVLDEPEIHLHTEWQVLYAEVIVLLQKYFDLSVIVTTHSPFFLDALEQYAMKHGTIGNANFYLSHAEKGYAYIEDVTGALHKIYDVITPSLATLRQLRHENTNLENE